MQQGRPMTMHEVEIAAREGRLIALDYSYLPRRRPWDPARSKVFQIIDRGSQRYVDFLKRAAKFAPEFERIQVHSTTPNDLAPQWVNGWFPGVDSITLYAMLALYNPRRYVEVGSGNSTMFARRAIEDHNLRTRIVSIDPHPRADIDRICDEIIRHRCEDVGSEFFDTLSDEDVFFVDNSHRSFQNSDVTVFFTEILPNLPTGIIYGLHDIYLPWDYPDEWRGRFYNEQYLLTAYLLGGADGDDVVCPNAYVSMWAPSLLEPLRGTLESPRLIGIEKTGGAFWLQRG